MQDLPVVVIGAGPQGLAAAAHLVERGERVLNCFSYHLTPAGFMFDAAARALGCVVVPAGVGQQDLQIRVALDGWSPVSKQYS